MEKLPYAPEDVMELDQVLLIAKEGNVKVGQPLVEALIGGTDPQSLFPVMSGSGLLPMGTPGDRLGNPPWFH